MQKQQQNIINILQSISIEQSSDKNLIVFSNPELSTKKFTFG
jgi:hypothetical protein